MHAPVVETHGLRKRFGAKLAVADLSLSLRPGEIFGFLGPNGAGKTTSLKMLLGLLEPSGGRGTLLGTLIGVLPGIVKRLWEMSPTYLDYQKRIAQGG
mgnify:CR=1 FL=1